MATDDRQARSAAKPSRRPWFDHITDQKPCLDRFRDPKGWLLQSLEKFKTEHPAAYPFDHSTLCAVNATGHSGPCTCEVVESGQEANRPGDATNAPGHDTRKR